MESPKNSETTSDTHNTVYSKDELVWLKECRDKERKEREKKAIFRNV